jgi:flagellar export protein FliJ
MAAAFRFRLERILKHTERTKQSALAEFSRSLQVRRTRERELSGLVAAKEATGAARPAIGTACPSGRLQTVQIRLEKLSGDIKRQDKEVRKAAAEVAQRRAAVVERRRETLKLMALRERRRALWRSTQLRLQQAEIDDIASSRALARRRTKAAQFAAAAGKASPRGHRQVLQ